MVLGLLIMLSLGRLSNAFRVQAIRYGRVAIPSVQNTFQLASRFSTMAQTESDDEVPFVPLRRGDEIKVKILRFGPLGASASINEDSASGLILQSEVQYAEKRRTEGNIKVGENLTGYVERVREDGKVDIALRPVDVLRIEVLKNEVLATLKASVNGTIEVGDKSPPERIAQLMNGMSKTDFKNAVGALYKEGLVRPSKLWVKLIPPENLEESKRKARKALEAQLLMREAEKKEQYRLDKLNQLKQKGEQSESDAESDSEQDNKRERNEECCLFVGNLPPNIEPKIFIHAVQSKILPENIVNIRLCRDQNGLSRGFGYVELVNESLVDASIEILKGHIVGGRKLRVDYANPERRYIVKARSERDFGPDSEEARRRRGSDVLPARARRGLLSERAISSSNDNQADGDGSAVKVGDWAPRYSALPQNIAKLSRHHPSDDSYFETLNHRSGARTRTGHVDPTKPAFEATLYFGNLPFDATKEDLQQEILNSKCIRAEDIASARIILDRETGLSKGYGYVDLYTAEAAEKIYEELHNHEFRGRPMKIDDATR